MDFNAHRDSTRVDDIDHQLVNDVGSPAQEASRFNGRRTRVWV